MHRKDKNAKADFPCRVICSPSFGTCPECGRELEVMVCPLKCQCLTCSTCNYWKNPMAAKCQFEKPKKGASAEPAHQTIRQAALGDFGQPEPVKEPESTPAPIKEEPVKKSRKAKAEPVEPVGPVEYHTICPKCESCKKCPVKTACSVPFNRDCISCKLRAGCGNYGHPDKGCQLETRESKEEKIPHIGWCSQRACQELDWEGGICIPTGKKIKEQTYCPTQHLAEKPQPEAEKPAKKPRSHKPKNAITDTTCQMAERMHCGPEDRAACEKSGKVRLLGVVCPVPVPCPEKNSMGTCMNGAYSCPHKTEEARAAVGCTYPIQPQHYAGDSPVLKKPAKKPKTSAKPYTIYIKKSDGTHPFIVSCDSRNFGGTSNPCDTTEEVVSRALLTLDGFVNDVKRSTLQRKPLPVTIETTLFIDKTGMFYPANFFDEAGEPKKPVVEPKKSTRKTKKGVA